MGDIIRRIVLELVWRTSYFKQLTERVYITEVGLTGHVSALDRHVAQQRNLKPLSRFEKWLCQPWIQLLRKEHRQVFREACLDVLGEDPEDWG